MKPSEVIREAIRLIRKNGWTTGAWQSPDGCMCLEGALLAGGGVEPTVTNSDRVLRAKRGKLVPIRKAFTAIALDTATDVNDLWLYNDHLDHDTSDISPRTVILRQMGKTARRLEKQGQ